MKIEAKVVVPAEQKGKIAAYASLTFDGSFVVSGLKIIEGSKGLFVSYPNEKRGEDYKDIAFPIKKETRDEISKIVLDAYDVAKATR